MQTPILFLGDNPALKSGLGRITRELAVLTSSLPEFRVGVLGRGGIGSRQLPFAQYTFPESSAAGTWGEGVIEHTWKDFSGGKQGIIFTIQDASRMLWFSRPHPEMGKLYDFLTSGRFKRWGYFPVDATGVGDRLTTASRAAIQGYDRILAYTAWGSQVIERSIGRSVDWIPHGYDADKFQPRGKQAGRMAIGMEEDEIVIGCVMTNQPRKDWATAFTAVSILAKKYPNLKFVAVTDMMERAHAWNFHALLADFGLEKQTLVVLTGAWNDTQMSYFYSACDVTILPSLGEGFGYPIVESLACGTPVIHGNYGGGAEIVPWSDWLVHPAEWRIEGIHNCLRPVFRPEDWAAAVEKYLETDDVRDTAVERCTASVEHLQWKNLWPSCWKKWILEGL